MPNVRKLDKLPKRKVTVDDLLELDDVNDVIQNIIANRFDIEELAVVYTLKNESGFHWHTNGMYDSRIMYMFESVKMDLFKPKEDG